MHKIEVNIKIISDFLNRDNSGHTIGNMVRYLSDDLLYTSQNSARVSIGNLMNRMLERKLVYCEEVPIGKIRFRKYWYLNNGVQKISGKE